MKTSIHEDSKAPIKTQQAINHTWILTLKSEPDENVVNITAAMEKKEKGFTQRCFHYQSPHLLCVLLHWREKPDVFWWRGPLNFSSNCVSLLLRHEQRLDVEMYWLWSCRTQILHSQNSLVPSLIHQSATTLPSFIDHSRFPHWSFSSFCCIWAVVDID